MKHHSLALCLALIFSFFCFSCSKDSRKKSKETKNKLTLEIKHSKSFDIQYFNKSKKITIKTPYPKAKEQFEYLLVNKVDSSESLAQIITPIENIVVTSTTHIPMLELLEVENRLVGFQNTKYVSSERTRKRIEQGFVKELGKEFSMNTEVLFELNPDVVVGFSMTKTNKTYNLIEQNGIPVIINGDWLEETPLGRAEWIKFFGALFDKKKEADSIFNKIESDYLAAIEIAKTSKNKPSILSGAIMRNDVWSLPGGESFVAQFLKDANVEYLWADSEGKGSLNLSFESVFDKGQDADFWIAPGYFSSKEQMLEANKHYADFKAFKNNNIYTPSTKTGKTGGVIYFELAPTRPDLVLKDIIKITNPELLPDYELTFFERMK
ncbi:ABC transporter substrate-binding protein [Pseudotenacibaculum sp. MALMAid0570]|uniref:ABC transporter substrate-binding protein n=1 Tax=Pseudotenacibaculum sp. MALMAid0570 TaxID=3143938 RepID=UPI0032E0201E